MRIFATILALIPYVAHAGSLVIGPDTIPSNTYRWLDGKTRSLGGMVYDGKNITVTRNAIRFWSDDDSNAVIRNATISLTKPTTLPGDLPVGIEFVGGHDNLVENVIAENFRSAVPGKEYENGDCFSGERKASRITFRNTLARNCSDGGYDFKSIDVRFENAKAEDVGKCYRIWGTATASTITCRHWRDGAIQMNYFAKGPVASFVVDKLTLDPDPTSIGVVVGVFKGATLTIKSCAGTLPARLIYWQPTSGAAPDNVDLTLCGVKVTTMDEAILRPIIEAQMAKDAQSR